MAKADARFGPIFAKFAAMPIEDVAKDPQALKMGARLFASNCSVCHGSDAKGAFGFPNLTDNDWRWGGEPDTIKTTIMGGRHGVMPVFSARPMKRSGSSSPCCGCSQRSKASAPIG